MHKEEIWQVYAKNGQPIEGVGWPAKLNNPEVTEREEIVGVAVVFLYRKNAAGGIELLWQKRSEKVDRFPGDYDISAGGHINLGESLVDAAVREVKEEIGASISVDDLGFVTMRPFNKNRFAWVYVAEFTGRDSDFHFDDEEVSEVKWVPWEETEEFKKKFAKKPLKNDTLTFANLEEYLRQHGEI